MAAFRSFVSFAMLSSWLLDNSLANSFRAGYDHRQSRHRVRRGGRSLPTRPRRIITTERCVVVFFDFTKNEFLLILFSSAVSRKCVFNLMAIHFALFW